MLYSREIRGCVALDGEPIKDRALSTVRSYQRRALASLTSGEIDFCKLISPVVKATGARYVKQAVVYVTDGISYRVDFIFRKYKLVVEIDGGSHGGELAMAKDEWRTAILKDKLGWTVIRFSNSDVARRHLLVRVAAVEALIASPHGYKKKLLEYAKTMRDHPDFARQST